jgi:DNA-binding transcriptional MerR regulator
LFESLLIDVQGRYLVSDHADLSIGDVSKITNLPAHTIRYWEKEFAEFLAPDRTPGLQRRYNERDIEIIEEIRHLLKVEGFSIAGAKRQLTCRYKREAQKLAVLETPAEHVQESPVAAVEENAVLEEVA